MLTLLLVLKICWNGKKVQEQWIQFGRLQNCCTGKKTICISISFFSLPRCEVIIIALDYIMPSPLQWRWGGQSLLPAHLRAPALQWVWKYLLGHVLLPQHWNSAESQALFKGASLEPKQYWLHMAGWIFLWEQVTVTSTVILFLCPALLCVWGVLFPAQRVTQGPCADDILYKHFCF